MSGSPMNRLSIGRRTDSRFSDSVAVRLQIDLEWYHRGRQRMYTELSIHCELESDQRPATKNRPTPQTRSQSSRMACDARANPRNGLLLVKQQHPSYGASVGRNKLSHWSFTLVANISLTRNPRDATGSPRGVSRSSLQNDRDSLAPPRPAGFARGSGRSKVLVTTTF